MVPEIERIFNWNTRLSHPIHGPISIHLPWWRYKKLSIISPNPKLLWMHNSAVKYVAVFLVLLVDIAALHQRLLTSSKMQRHKSIVISVILNTLEVDLLVPDSIVSVDLLCLTYSHRIVDFVWPSAPIWRISIDLNSKEETNTGAESIRAIRFIFRLISRWWPKILDLEITALCVLGIDQLFEGGYITKCQQQEHN